MKRRIRATVIITVVAFVVSVLVVSGCSTTHSLKNTAEKDGGRVFSIEGLNTTLSGKRAVIVLNDQTKIPASNIVLSSDSVHWIRKGTKADTVAPIGDVEKIVTKDGLGGGFDGAGFGFLAGAGAGGVIGTTIQQNDPWHDKGDMVNTEVISGAGGGIFVGFLAGAIIGHAHEYVLHEHSEADSAHSTSSEEH